MAGCVHEQARKERERAHVLMSERQADTLNYLIPSSERAGSESALPLARSASTRSRGRLRAVIWQLIGQSRQALALPASHLYLLKVKPAADELQEPLFSFFAHLLPPAAADATLRPPHAPRSAFDPRFREFNPLDPRASPDDNNEETAWW